MTPDLTMRITEALDQAERLARAATPGKWRWATPADSTELHLMGQGFKPIVPLGEFFHEADAALVAAFADPASVLRSVAADRRVLARHRAKDGNCTVCCGEPYLDEYWDGEEESTEWKRNAVPWPCDDIRDLVDRVSVTNEGNGP